MRNPLLAAALAAAAVACFVVALNITQREVASAFWMGSYVLFIVAVAGFARSTFSHEAAAERSHERAAVSAD